MVVWIVSQGSYEEEGVCGVFEDLADAMEFASTRKGLYYHRPNPEWKLDNSASYTDDIYYLRAGKEYIKIEKWLVHSKKV